MIVPEYFSLQCSIIDYLGNNSHFKIYMRYSIIQKEIMKIDSLLRGLFKQSPLQKEFKAINLLNDTLTDRFLNRSYSLFQTKYLDEEESFVKLLLKGLQEKNAVGKKIKIMILWIELSKSTKYDLSDILLSKKIKLFTKPISIQSSMKELDKVNVDGFMSMEILVPLYNYFMKLSINEELFRTCVGGTIPENDIFRRGTKIRFIWIFKIYNLINSLIPILNSLMKFILKFNNLKALIEIAEYLFRDLTYMNDFIAKAIMEGSQDNFLLMPYMDMLQFYQSIKQQLTTELQITHIYQQLKKFMRKDLQLPKPMQINISEETFQEINTQALRVKLISNSLKNPKKNWTLLETQYHENIGKKKFKQFKTETSEDFKLEDQFRSRFINLQ